MATRRFCCKKCGSFEGYRSRSRGLVEKLFLPCLLLRPLRCGGCFRRSYGSILTHVLKRDELQIVTQVMASGAGALHARPPALYTESNSSGSGPVSSVRTEEARLQQ